MNLTLPILKGLQNSYDAILVKDPNKIYITTDTGKIFLGDINIGASDIGKVVRSIDFNSNTQVFTIIYTDNTETIIDLVLESVIQDISYDSETRTLTITLVNGATTDISLADLVDIYVGSTTNTTITEVDTGEIFVDVKISSESGNAITIESDGLYVATPQAVSGNIVVGTSSGIGDSGRTIVSLIEDSTAANNIPDITAIKSVLAVGTF